MRHVLLGALLLVLAGCHGMSAELKGALKIQTKYTRQYIEATMPGVKDEEIRGIGERLLENCDAIDELVRAEEE